MRNAVCNVLVLVYGIGVVCATDCPDRWTSFQGSCYLFPHDMMVDFITAENYCRQHNSHLVHINNAIENSFIKDFLRYEKKECHWLGLTDELVEGVWQWYDTNESITYTDWYPGEPNNFQTTQDCAIFAPGRFDFSWDDMQCTDHCEPTCEQQPGEVEIVG